MSFFLDQHRKPVILFDVDNPTHRLYFSNFLKRGTWGSIPIRFYSPGSISVKEFATNSLLDFYINSEFPGKKPRVHKNLSKVT